jgi:hypothetical protein
MAKAKLLRQYLEDYNRKAGAANEEYQQRYDAYKGQVDAYNAAGEEYQAWVNQIKYGQSTGLSKTEEGLYAQLGSHDGDFAWSNRNKQGKPYDARALYGSMAELEALGPGQMGQDYGSEYGPSWVPNEGWVRNADGTATKYTGSGEVVKLNPGDSGYAEPLPDYTGNGNSSGWRLPDGTVVYQDPNVQTRASWVAGPTLRVVEFNNPQPTEPVASEEIRAPNLTQSDIRELRNPSQDAAGVQAGINKGLIVKSELADNERSKVSAFADPEDPNNLKDAGILARVLGGQL